MTNNPDNDLKLYNQQLKNKDSLFNKLVKSKLPQDFSSKLDNALSRIEIIWGFLIRSLFIFSIGFFGYNYLSPQSIKDIPFSQLTLDLLFNNIFSGVLVVGCVLWFFSFPSKSDKPEESPYKIWANVGYFIICIALFIWIKYNP